METAATGAARGRGDARARFVKVSARPPLAVEEDDAAVGEGLTAAMPLEPSRRPETDGAPNHGDATSPSAVISATVAVSPVRTTAQKRSASTQATSSSAAGRPRIRSRSAADTSSSARPPGRPAKSSPPLTKVGLPSAAGAKAQSRSRQAMQVSIAGRNTYSIIEHQQIESVITWELFL